ncbi:hypothetical protein PG985_004532 [Apiospora marii]|uniref:3-hydroxyacyl-CoA dehydrogenase NAD binding domain-containing protein n=1 Tax=Apiospora marii TaxID=335849 RepID=A0ABR1S9K7_9PEZI
MSSTALPSITNRPVAVLGGGDLGRLIAIIWAKGRHDVNIYENDKIGQVDLLQWCRTASDPRGQESPEQGAVHASSDLNATVQHAWLVIEAMPEVLSVKTQMFRQLAAAAPRDAVLCTSSSEYKSRQLVTSLEPSVRSRMLNMRYYMTPSTRVVELMGCGETDPDVLLFLASELRRSGMRPWVLANDSAGFIFGRLWAAIQHETARLLEQGVLLPRDIGGIQADLWEHAVSPSLLAAEHPLSQKYPEMHTANSLPEPNTKVPRVTFNDKDPSETWKRLEQAQQVPISVEALQKPLMYFVDVGLRSDVIMDAYHAGRILSGSPDGKPLRALASGQYLPDGIDVSPATGQIFWTSMGVPGQQDGAVFSSNLDGDNVEEIVGRGVVNTPKQLVVEPQGRKIYFADREGLAVWRCDFDGSELEMLVRTGDPALTEQVEDPARWCVGVSVSVRTGHLYWTQKGPPKGNKGRIFRAHLEFLAGEDAGNRSDVQCLLRNLPEPINLAIDQQENQLYWTDRGEIPIGNSINRVSLDRMTEAPLGGIQAWPGRDYELLVRYLNEAIGIKLDLEKRHIYAAELSGTIYRFAMDGSNKITFYEKQGTYAGMTIAYV